MAEWRFLLDENIDPKVATYLKKENLYAIHVREAVGQGADDEADILPYAQQNELIILTSDVTDFDCLPRDVHADVILLYDDSMPAYRIATTLIGMVDAYTSRNEFRGREVLDTWVYPK